jgi:hypothetical protein
MEALLRHLKFTEPETQHWMNMGNVGRGAMNGFIDADTFRDDTTNQIKGLLLAVELLAKKCAYLEKQIK